MKLAIMQPYFFPYLGHFALIAATNRWVAFDVVQYQPRSWMNRNRVLHPRSGWQYVGVPVRKSPRGTPIHEITMANKDAALTRIIRQLDHYRRVAPFHGRVVDLVRAAFAATPTDKLADLAAAGLREVCGYLGMDIHWSRGSDLPLSPAAIEHPGDWALAISRMLGASCYVNPAGGRHLFRPEDWRTAGIDLAFLDQPPFRYSCGRRQWIENLSILDVLMWNDAPTTRAAALSATIHT